MQDREGAAYDDMCASGCPFDVWLWFCVIDDSDVFGATFFGVNCQTTKHASS